MYRLTQTLFRPTDPPINDIFKVDRKELTDIGWHQACPDVYALRAKTDSIITDDPGNLHLEFGEDRDNYAEIYRRRASLLILKVKHAWVICHHERALYHCRQYHTLLSHNFSTL